MLLCMILSTTVVQWNTASITSSKESAMNHGVYSAIFTAFLQLFVLSSSAILPPYVLSSDQPACECYQEALYPAVCPQITPQLPEVCENIDAYVYDSTQTSHFCSESCLQSLATCYQQYSINCDFSIITYYNLSFCSQDQSGDFCLSIGVDLLKMLADLLDIEQCAEGILYCPSPSSSCGFLCKTGLNLIVNQFGCCARSLFDDPHSPFMDYTITNVNTFSNCGVSLGTKCPYIAPSPQPVPLPQPALSSQLVPSSQIDPALQSSLQPAASNSEQLSVLFSSPSSQSPSLSSSDTPQSQFTSTFTSSTTSIASSTMNVNMFSNSCSLSLAMDTKCPYTAPSLQPAPSSQSIPSSIDSSTTSMTTILQPYTVNTMDTQQQLPVTTMPTLAGGSAARVSASAVLLLVLIAFLIQL